jgi:hypothetical protein
MAQKSKNPPAGGARRARKCDQLAAYHASEHNPSLAYLQAFASRLHAMGPRVIAELLADLARGRDYEETIADFARLDPATYSAVAALVLEGRA